MFLYVMMLPENILMAHHYYFIYLYALIICMYCEYTVLNVYVLFIYVFVSVDQFDRFCSRDQSKSTWVYFLSLKTGTCPIIYKALL